MIKHIPTVFYTAHHGTNHYECQELATKINEVIDAVNSLNKPNQPTWISVADRLPERDGTDMDDDSIVVFVSNRKTMGTGRYSHLFNRWTYRMIHCCEDSGTEITHWMPLPEPPK